MFNFNGGHVLALEVIAGTNLPEVPVPSGRTPIGYYVRVSTSNGRWNTTIKAAEANSSVSWDETLNIHGPPPTFLQWLMSIVSRTSQNIDLEIRALYESGPERVCAFETTFEQLLGRDGQSTTLPAINSQNISLTSTAQCSIITTPHAPSSSPETRPLDRNVVIFGDTGSGKSSLINRITQHLLAETSNDAHGCTSTPECYPVEISNRKYVLIDTPGLNEGYEGAVPDAEAKKLLKSLLRELMSSRLDYLGLLVYCVRNGPQPRTFVKAYNKFSSGICHDKVPIILVVEGLEKGAMETWWNNNGRECTRLGMRFANNPYDPASQPTPKNVTHHVVEPNGFWRNLISNHYSDLVVDASWSERISGACDHDDAGGLFSTSNPAGDLGDDSVKQQAAQDLQDIIRRSRPHFK
ncbi:P-loop containing nucleoside triphosphate hydrolase protein [Suillus placidus]|uniref:P-loop containing nucleoside triphosphate hydrolase protein n=1 Tax=Suillus placidus TaxID=48579 RepID=A0A9P6ZYH9_9AGAM|nr:P-loop containing nucleoside triphosphate hydrolase protein [Suillus placidus]